MTPNQKEYKRNPISKSDIKEKNGRVVRERECIRRGPWEERRKCRPRKRKRWCKA